MDEAHDIARATSGIAQTKPIIKPIAQIRRETEIQNKKLKKRHVDQAKGMKMLNEMGFSNCKAIKMDESNVKTETSSQPKNLDVYLSNCQNEALMNSILETQDKTTKFFDERYRDARKSEWDHFQRQIIESLTGASIGAMTSVRTEKQKQWAPSSTLKSISGIITSILSSKKERRFKSDLIRQFSQIADRQYPSTIDNPIPVIKSTWDILQKMLNDLSGWRQEFLASSMITGENITAIFQEAHTNPRSPRHVDLIRWLLIGSRSFINTETRKELGLNALLPFDALISKIRDFVISSFSQSASMTIIDKIPIWGVLFFLLKCGFIKEAQEFTRRCAGNTEFTTITRIVGGIDESKGSFQLSDEDAEILAQTLQALRPRSRDPFIELVFASFLPSNFQDTSVKINNTHVDEDLWIQITKILNTRSELLLEELKKLRNYRRHIPFRSPLYQFKDLILTLQFEEAVSFLHNTQFQPESLYFAIALHFHGLFRESDPTGQSMSFETLIQHHAKQLISSSVFDAARLILLMNDTNRRDELLLSFIIELRRFDLLGLSDNPDNAGNSILPLLPEGEDEVLLRKAAHKTKQLGLDDAISLFDACGDTDELFRLLVDKLVKSMPIPRERANAYEFAILFHEKNIEALPHSRFALKFTMCLDIAYFYLLSDSSPIDALNLAAESSLLPLTPNQIEMVVSNIGNLEEIAIALIPDFVLKGMEVVQAVLRDPRTSDLQATCVTAIETLLRFERDLPIRFPPNILEKMIRIQAESHK